MKKRIISVFVLLITLFLIFTACNGDDNMNVQFKMKAKILAINEHVEIEILEDEYNSGILWVNYSNQTIIKDNAGNTITINDLKVGDHIEIIYNGQVMMSYPGQIAARKIILL
jgi:hypothetical protein